MIVTTDGLNLRSAPDTTTDDNIIKAMQLAQEVKIISAPEGERFWEIEATIGGETKRGFASSRYLRQPLSQAKEKLIAAAVKEWITFGRGIGEEHKDPYYKRIGDYYTKIGYPGINGKHRDTPWSAAFMSFIVLGAGYTGFRHSNGHYVYMNDAKVKREANNSNAPFWLFKLNEHKPQLGDLVCGWRKPEDYPEHKLVKTYDQVRSDFFPSHTDVIVEIKSDSITTIGGNVDHSVKTKTIPRDVNGYVTAEDKRFAIMRNNR